MAAEAAERSESRGAPGEPRAAGAVRPAPGAARLPARPLRRQHAAVIPAADIVERFHIPPESLEEHLQLLNLVNFGGGCYAVYTELQDSRVHVEKELFGDTFRSPPRLTPLEARRSGSRSSSSGR